MKTPSVRRASTPLLCACLAALVTGCFDTKQEFTINPNGSGKVIHESTFQSVNLSEDKPSPADALKEAIAKVIESAEGVEAWRDLSFKRLDDGRLHFKGTAYFKELSRLNIPNQTMMEFEWKKSDAGGGVLTLRTNKSEAKEGLRLQKKPVDLTSLTPEERTAKLKEERAQFQRMKPMFEGFIGTMKHEVVLHLPGKIEESSNFTNDAAGTLRIGFDGMKLLGAMEKLLLNDAWAAKHAGGLSMQGKPALDDEVSELVFGKKAPVRASVAAGKPLFDYASEVAAAKLEFAKQQKALGLGPITVAPPAQGGTLKSVKVVGVRLIKETDKKREIRPFNFDAGYTIALLGELPGSVLSVTDKSGLDTAIADDGTSLLPDSEWSRKFSFPNLTTDKAGVVFEARLLPPGPGVKGIKELSGHIDYSVAGASKEVDLGIEELKENVTGTELGAQITSIKEGWKKDGSQEMELKLKISKDLLKSVYLAAGATKTELKQRGYSSSGNTCTINCESKTVFPAKGRLVVEIYDDLKTYHAPFKLENFSLLGAPLEAK